MGQMGGAPRDPNAILNTCKEIDRGIDSIEHALQSLTSLHARALRETGDTSHSDAEIQNLSRETVTMYQNLVARVKRLKTDPESGNQRNSAQVGKVHRRLKEAIQQFQQVEAKYRNDRKEQMQRAIRIARPDATEEEVQQAAEDPNGGQVFTHAVCYRSRWSDIPFGQELTIDQKLMDRDRRGQAQSALAANKKRHEAIQKIEREMVELAQLFQDLDTMVIQQEPAITNIEQKGEQVEDNVARANTHIDGAIGNAKAARRKKFWCLGISSESTKHGHFLHLGHRPLTHDSTLDHHHRRRGRSGGRDDEQVTDSFCQETEVSFFYVHAPTCHCQEQ